MVNKVVKLGLLFDDKLIPAWMYESLKRVLEYDFVITSLLIHSPKTQNNTKPYLYKMYESIDKKLFSPEYDASKLKPSKDLFGDINSFDINDIEKIKNYDLDIIINLSTLNDISSLQSCVKLGIYSFVGVDEDRFFYDIVSKKPLLQSHFICETKDSTLLLSTSSSQVLSYSTTRDVNEQLWTLASLLPLELKKLSNLGQYHYFSTKKTFSLSATKTKSISNLSMLPELGRFSFRVVKKLIEKKLYKEQWFLMYKDEEDFSFENMKDYKHIISPKDVFWADPFVVEKEDKRYIFIEEEPLNAHGHISLITLEKDGTYSPSTPIIKNDYHMSYPFIFTHEGEYYMVPETSENRTVELYKAISFPHKWEFQQNLMNDIHAVDTTLFFKDEKWWLFTSITEFKGGWDNGSFSLFFSDDLFGEWSPHPQNPISINPNHSRMAGSVFEKDEKLYRPTQNSSKRYGYGFNLEEITELNTTSYKEKSSCEVIPDFDSEILGVHTLNYAKNFTLIDGVKMKKRVKR